MARLLICDLDGTLLDTLEDLGDSMNDALSSLGFPRHPLAAYRAMIGDGAHMLAARAAPAWQRDATAIDALYEAYLQAYARRWHLKTRPYAGIPELLDACVAGGVKLAVFSNKADVFAQETVRHFLAGWGWAEIRGQRSDTPRKPAPDGALAIAFALGVSPEECVFLGDSGVDMQCANAAGMTAIGARWGFRPAEELAAHGAHHLAASPAEVWDFLSA